MPAPDDETRVAAPTPDGWLSSSGAIDHGRFAPGTVLGGRYRIVGRLGRGGMGEVFRADDLKLGQPVALKFLPADVDRDPARLTQLHAEVRMARQVSHPNVCRVYDIDEVEGHTFLSMEYVDGEDLASLLRRIGRFPEERALEIARQICAGLGAAHERGVVHRDFKPANVMLDGSGRVRITDFGLAGVAGEPLRAGTPTYMAPEQLGGGAVTVRSDIYALGLVLYEVFTGQRALDGRNLAELIRRREQAEIVPPASLVRDLSPEIDRAIMRCLAPDPEARPPSAMSVSAALPGGDPLAAALAAGETPSPEMVAASGEAASLSRAAGVALMAFVVLGLLAAAWAADRVLLIGRMPLDRSADLLEEQARNVLAAAGIPGVPADAARGVAVNGEYISYVAGNDRSPSRWDALAAGHAPGLRFWYRTSPRHLVPLAPNWRPASNDPPLDVPGMSIVTLDGRGRLLEFLTVPPQLDASPPAGDAVDWRPMFDAAGLPLDAFTRVEPRWTPRVFAERRVAWEGAMPNVPDVRLRVEGAEYRGRPASFHVLGPWSRPTRMEGPQATAVTRALSAAGTLLITALIAGAVLLVRYHLKSGRADRRGATRVAWFIMAVWLAAWAFGARHSLDIDLEWTRFFTFIAFALTNVTLAWVLYLALEPLVRRYYPEILISWTRLLAGRFTDPRVGRDVLIGVATGVFIALVRLGYLLVPVLAGDASTPQASSLLFLLGDRYVVSAMLVVLPSALQNTLVGTFLFVMLRAIVGRTWIATAIAVALMAITIVFESGRAPVAAMAIAIALVAAPAVFIFLRYGLLALGTAILVNQVLLQLPMTADPQRPHAVISSWTLLALWAAAGWAFHVSRAGRGMLSSFLPRL